MAIGADRKGVLTQEASNTRRSEAREEGTSRYSFHHRLLRRVDSAAYGEQRGIGTALLAGNFRLDDSADDRARRTQLVPAHRAGRERYSESPRR